MGVRSIASSCSLNTLESLESRTLLAAAAPAVAVPRPDHIVVVVEENHAFNELFAATDPVSGQPIGPQTESAPYLQSLAKQGALFTNSFAITHPSQPNYLALFSGSTQQVTDDSYLQPTLTAANLGGELFVSGHTFGGYAEDLKRVGYTGDKSGGYRKKHNPWVDFTDVPASANLPLNRFPKNFANLPTVSFVVPTDAHNMHDGSVGTADSWLRKHLGAYVKWAQTHNSLLIVAWDEDDTSQGNQVPTLFVGPMVKPGQYGEQINHYNVLRTIEDAYGLGHAGASETAAPITDVWR
jgi:acid phosphatase